MKNYIIILFFLQMNVIRLFAAPTDYFMAKTGGNWSSPGIWYESTVSSTNPNDYTTPATNFPTDASAGIIINSEVIADTSISADQLTVASGAMLSLPSGKTLTILDGTGTDITVNGTLDMDGGVFFLLGTIVYGSSSTLLYSSSTNAHITSAEILESGMANITIDASEIVTLSTPCGMNGNLSILNGGFYTNAQFMEVLGNCDINASIEIDANGFDVYGSFDATGGEVVLTGGTLMLYGDVISLGNFDAGMVTSYVDYAGSGSQTIVPETYWDLIVSGTGTKTLGGPIALNNDLYISFGATLDVSTNNYSISIYHDFLNYGTFNAREGSILFDGGSMQTIVSGGSELYSLLLEQDIGFADNAIVTGPINLLEGYYMTTTSGTQLTFSGETSGAGGFSSSEGEISYTRNGDQVIYSGNYGMITLSGSGTKSFSQTTTSAYGVHVDGSMVITGEGHDTTRVRSALSKGSGHSSVFNIANGNVEIRDMGVHCGYTEESGGGIYANNTDLTLTNLYISANVSELGGGGIAYEGNGSLIMDSCTVFNNDAYDGGGIYATLTNGDLSISNSTISFNTLFTDGVGGGISAGASSVTIDSCLVEHNWACSGGGMILSSSTTINISKTIIRGNSAEFSGSTGGDGGGLFLYPGNETNITNCLISGNTAYYGGAISCYAQSIGIPEVNYINTTISGNYSDSSYKAIDYLNVIDGSLEETFTNCIIWGNSALGNYAPIPNVSSTYNYCNTQESVKPGIGNISSDPLFTDPLDYTTTPSLGGDFYLLPCSPCINAGNSGLINETLDIDGNQRIQFSNVDMGAYESVAEDTENPVLSVTNLTVQLDSLGVAGISPGDVVVSASDNCSISDTSLSISNFSCDNIAVPVNIDVTITDHNGNSDGDVATITVQDTIKPLLTVQDITIYLDNEGTANIESSGIVVNASDNCAIEDTVFSQTTFDCSDIGSPISIEVTLNDVNGNSISSSANVSITDTISPMLTVQNISIYLDNSGSAHVEASDIILSATDNCEIQDTIISQTSFSCNDCDAPVGINVTLNDAHGNTTIAPVVINVIDSISPVASVQDYMVYLDHSGSATIEAHHVISNIIDNCSVLDTALSRNTFSIPDTAQTVDVQITISDNSGNYSVYISSITVDPATTSVVENDIQKLKAYPNPASNIIYIEPEVDIQLGYTIYTASGIVVDKGRIPQNQIKINELQPGVYLLKIEEQLIRILKYK